MISSPLVSIILPVYNVEKYLERCINSIINQSYRNLEIILINDGSTDHSTDIIEKYLNDQRIIYVNKCNSGQSDSRYIGYNMSTGEFVYFVDSDDFLEPNAIEVLLNTALSNNADFSCCRYRIIDSNLNVVKESKLFQQQYFDNNKIILSDALQIKNIKFTLWSKLFNKTFLEENGLKPERRIKLHDDCMFTFLCSIYARRVAFTNEILYNVVQHENSISRIPKPLMVTIYDMIFDILKKQLEKTSKFKDNRDYFYYSYAKSILYALMLACTRSRTFSQYKKIWESINPNSLYYSKELKTCIKHNFLKLYIPLAISKRPFIYYTLSSTIFRNKFKH